VALARALAHHPSLLLADEPTGNLDSANTSDVLRLLCRSHASGQAILLVTHDARAACRADRVINLFHGMVADDADLPRVASPPAPASGVLELKG
jgi:putative ABC transport system ATP-binding protein